jgi:Protein of unknown function (DUF3237)
MVKSYRHWFAPIDGRHTSFHHPGRTSAREQDRRSRNPVYRGSSSSRAALPRIESKRSKHRRFWFHTARGIAACLKAFAIPESGSLLFEVEVKLDRILDLGKTPYGFRRVAVGADGVVSGSKLSASVMPGALDLELTLANGTIEIEQLLVLKTTDEKYIYIRNAGTGADANDTRVVVDFEAPSASS